MSRRRQINTSSATAATVTVWPRGTVSSGQAVSSGAAGGRPPPTHKQKETEAAVYGHIKAMRVLGHIRINSVDIARALSLPISDVEEAMRKLGDKGVRIIG